MTHGEVERQEEAWESLPWSSPGGEAAIEAASMCLCFANKAEPCNRQANTEATTENMLRAG